MSTPDPIDGTHLALPSRLDLTASAPLRDALLARRGRALTIDAGAVSHLGTLCLQILLSAAAEWRRERLAFTLSPCSSAFSRALVSFAIPLLALHSEG